jgi:hypothetical protein
MPDPAANLPLPSTDDIAALRAIVEGTARATGEEFFQSLVRHLAAAIDVHYAYIDKLAGATTSRACTLAPWGPGTRMSTT